MNQCTTMNQYTWCNAIFRRLKALSELEEYRQISREAHWIHSLVRASLTYRNGTLLCWSNSIEFCWKFHCGILHFVGHNGNLIGDKINKLNFLKTEHALRPINQCSKCISLVLLCFKRRKNSFQTSDQMVYSSYPKRYYHAAYL